MLKFAEEVILLALDDSTGKLLPLPDRALDFALAGACLGELAYRGRITADEDAVIVINAEPLDDDALVNSVLQMLVCADANQTLQHWLASIANRGTEIRDRLLERLVAKGILRTVDDRFWWVFHIRRYPIADQREELAVRQRIRNVILHGAVPTQRDTILIALMDVCHLSYTILTEDELGEFGSRLRNIAEMDCIGKAVAHAISQIQLAILEVRAYAGI